MKHQRPSIWLLILRTVVFALLAEMAWPQAAEAGASADSPHATIAPNDNRRPGGGYDNGTFRLALRAAIGDWKPEGPTGPALQVEAFGEIGSTLSIPAPLIRVVEGTAMAVSIRNDLGAALTVHGLCSRDGGNCATVDVPPLQTREVRFTSGRAGTYHYWASSMGAPVPLNELAGAFVVDPVEERVHADRIMVITEWTSLTPDELRRVVSADDAGIEFLKMQPRIAFAINGLSWPATEGLIYELGEQVRWRVINLSSQSHPMHLHGFYFEVNSVGNGYRDQAFDETRQRRVVTQLLPSGGTMTMTWVPEREGNWLFHCHIMAHVSPERRLAESDGTHSPHTTAAHAQHDKSAGMAGMIVGVTVRGSATTNAPDPRNESTVRKLTLAIRPVAASDVASPRAGFVLSEGNTPSSDRVASPGPPLVLRRDEPVEITVVNELREPTAIHWHGMELESYYDGVHNWSGIGLRRAPLIEPGAKFVVRFTPPRAGTFIYHTHLHDYRQLSSGLYGPLIVTEPGEAFDPDTDHVVVLGRSGVTSEAAAILRDPDSVVVNGERAPRLVWRAGTRHRLRLINIAPDDIFTVSLQTADSVVTWTPRRKDGAPLPAAECVSGPARQTIAVGETYDFEYQAPEGRRNLWLEVRSTGGKWQAQGLVVIK